jgi:hypothetical protein
VRKQSRSTGATKKQSERTVSIEIITGNGFHCVPGKPSATRATDPRHPHPFLVEPNLLARWLDQTCPLCSGDTLLVHHIT